MPQLVDFPPFSGDVRAQIVSLGRIAKALPAAGEPFREFRARLREAKLWDREHPLPMLRFLGVGGATIRPSSVIERLAAAGDDDAIAAVVVDRMWQCNPLLGKAVLGLVAERAYGKDEIYKYLGSFAYKGKVPSRPALETWLQVALACGVLRSVGIAVAAGPQADPFSARAAELDVDEFLAEDRPEAEPELPSVDEVVAPAGPAASVAAAASAIPQVVAPMPTAPVVGPVLRHLSSAAGLSSPRGKGQPLPVSRFAQGFSDEVLDETSARLAAWWAESGNKGSALGAADFGLDAEAWVEGANEVLYRVAVAAALLFRLDADRDQVVAAFRALDQAGVLADLYHGTVPEQLPAAVDSRALMLASLAARRCAESPDLAATLEQQKSGADVFAALEAALGRGLFRIELFWIVQVLADLGVIRHDDLSDYTVLPHRLVRDTLFRLGYLATPYAADAVALAAAARAARRACGKDAKADEMLASFAIATGCGYDCPHRKSCDFACRERLD